MLRFLSGLCLGVLIGWATPSFAQEAEQQQPDQPFRAGYSMICMLPEMFENIISTQHLLLKSQEISADTQHLWRRYENDKEWLLVFNQASRPFTCLVDHGPLDTKGS